jgi:hypothetical protein
VEEVSKIHRGDEEEAAGDSGERRRQNMISKRIRIKVENATVTILKKGGRGVLVKNGLILTAAHCIEFKCDGEMALGDYFIEEIETSEGKKLKVVPYAVEPVSDIAVLGSLDGQTFYKEATEFENFCEGKKGLSLCLKKFAWRVEVPGWIYTHKKTWIKGKMTKYDTKKNAPTISFDADEDIEAGTSGSPIINERGELMGIVSYAAGTDGTTREGMVPSPLFALPVWLYQEITAIEPHSLYTQISKKREEEVRKKDVRDSKKRSG